LGLVWATRWGQPMGKGSGWARDRASARAWGWHSAPAKPKASTKSLGLSQLSISVPQGWL
jgi:hypothetical protein